MIFFIFVLHMDTQVELCCYSLCRSCGQPTAANVDIVEQTDVDDVFSLQFGQWTVPQFCVRVLDNVVRCLQGTANEQLSMQCFKLIHQVAALLADSVIPSALWEDASLPAHELVTFMLMIITCNKWSK